MPVAAGIWGLLCALLLSSATLKILNVDTFAAYLEVAFGLGRGETARWAAIAICTAEVALPLLSLARRTQWLSYFGTCLLFLAFSTFHGARMAAGNYLPCACFGSVLVLETQYFLALNLAAAAASGWLVRLNDAVRPQWSRAPIAATLLWAGCALCLYGLEAKMVYGYGRQADIAGHAAAVDVSPKDLIDGAALVYRPAIPTTDSIVIFGDYQCPFCQKVMEQLRSRTFLGVNVYWRELPLEGIHDKARTLAVLSRLGARSGQIAELQPKIFDAGRLSLSGTNDLAKTLGFEGATEEDLDQARVAVATDLILARKLELSSTPALYAIQTEKVFRLRDAEAAAQLFSDRTSLNTGDRVNP